jgi:hypothetical protein
LLVSLLSPALDLQTNAGAHLLPEAEAERSEA